MPLICFDHSNAMLMDTPIPVKPPPKRSVSPEDAGCDAAVMISAIRRLCH